MGMTKKLTNYQVKSMALQQEYEYALSTGDEKLLEKILANLEELKKNQEEQLCTKK
jgi:BioD-like phosphotransacetylase family protein